MRVAFVHDYLTQFGGAERVLLEMHHLYPNAPIYTSLYDPKVFGQRFAGIDVRTSFLQRLPGAPGNFRMLLPLYPRAFESLDLRGYDLVISSTTSFAKGVRVPAGTLHISYINTPTRFLWYPQEYANDIVPPVARPLLAALSPSLRRWDWQAAQRPHYLVANSRNVAERIVAAYGRSSDVVHCPVSIDAAPAPQQSSDEVPGEYYLVISRLLPYKRVHLAIEACNQIGAKLIIAGNGPDERRLRLMAAGRTEFAGYVDDMQRQRLVANARAIIVPGVEDFGLVPLEAAAAGRPTVAFGSGGALETIVEGETGLFFYEPSVRALAQTLEALSQTHFDRARMQAHAATFAPEVFRAKLSVLIERYRAEFGKRRVISS